MRKGLSLGGRAHQFGMSISQGGVAERTLLLDNYKSDKITTWDLLIWNSLHLLFKALIILYLFQAQSNVQIKISLRNCRVFCLFDLFSYTVY